MDVVIPAILIAAAAAGFWLTQVYLPRQRRLKRDLYLEIIGDEGTDDIETGYRNDVRRRSGSSDKESTRYRYARLRLEAPWSQLTCSLGPGDVPTHESPFVHESPTEVQVLYCWGYASEALERLKEPAVTAAIRVFLGGDGRRSILGGRLQVEQLAAEADPMSEISMMTDISDLRRVLG